MQYIVKNVLKNKGDKNVEELQKTNSVSYYMCFRD